MTDPVAPDEILARYIVYSGWIRQSDKTVKQEAFIPPPNLELSVTRHLHLTEEEIWGIGKRISQGMNPPRHLHGRADVETWHVVAQSLAVMAQPVPDNPNHANIVGWPAEKELRKARALEIARGARFVTSPE